MRCRQISARREYKLVRQHANSNRKGILHRCEGGLNINNNSHSLENNVVASATSIKDKKSFFREIRKIHNSRKMNGQTFLIDNKIKSDITQTKVVT